jgi:hypothetical protein
MVSCISIIVKMMTFWNFLCDSYRNIKNRITNFYNYLSDYFCGHHDMWVFVPGHTTPISLNNIYNNVQASWVYDNSNTSLKICTTSETDLTAYKFSWLSASIRIYNSSNTYLDYNIDDYIENFTLNTIDNIVPSLYLVFISWCASTKHWFSPEDLVEFHIIDDMGEDIVLNLDEHNESLFIKHNKISVIIDSGEEAENHIINPEENVTEETPLTEVNNDKEE